MEGGISSYGGIDRGVEGGTRVVRVVSGWYLGWYMVPIYTRHIKKY